MQKRGIEEIKAGTNNMKLRNHYAWLCVVWIISALLQALCAVVNFVEGDLFVGFLFLILSCSFSFVGGLLLDKALMIYHHNKFCDMLKNLPDNIEEEKPFEEFESER